MANPRTISWKMNALRKVTVQFLSINDDICMYFALWINLKTEHNKGRTPGNRNKIENAHMYKCLSLKIIS